MEPFRHFLINAPFPAVNEFLCAALLAGTQYFAVILQAGDISDGNVFTQRKAVFAEILKQYAEAPAQLRRVILTGICTVKQDIALGRLIETQAAMTVISGEYKSIMARAPKNVTLFVISESFFSR